MTMINPIKTESDYEAALERIETLWGTAPDTTEGDELDVLITLVEAYEAKHYPIEPPDPIEAARFAIESKILGRVSESRFKEDVYSLHKRALKKVNSLLNQEWQLSADSRHWEKNRIKREQIEQKIKEVTWFIDSNLIEILKQLSYL